jgi:hypothetical protein
LHLKKHLASQKFHEAEKVKNKVTVVGGAGSRAL